MATRISRVRLGAAVVTAFICGLLFASGIDLTRFGFAQDGKGGAKVASSQVQSLAETGNAFEAIADHVTPSVVSIQTQRVQRNLRSRNPRTPPGSGPTRSFPTTTDAGLPRDGPGAGMTPHAEGRLPQAEGRLPQAEGRLPQAEGRLIDQRGRLAEVPWQTRSS